MLAPIAGGSGAPGHAAAARMPGRIETMQPDRSRGWKVQEKAAPATARRASRPGRSFQAGWLLGLLGLLRRWRLWRRHLLLQGLLRLLLLGRRRAAPAAPSAAAAIPPAAAVGARVGAKPAAVQAAAVHRPWRAHRPRHGAWGHGHGAGHAATWGGRHGR